MKSARKRLPEPPPEVSYALLPHWLFTSLVVAWTSWCVYKSYVLSRGFLPDIVRLSDVAAAARPAVSSGLVQRCVIVLVFWLLSFALGERILQVLGRNRRAAEVRLVAAGLGSGLLSLLLLALAASKLWRPQFLQVFFFGGAVLMFVLRYFVPPPAPDEAAQPAAPKPDAFERLAVIPLIITLATMLLTTSAPEAFYDSLVYHLALPKLYLINAGLVPTPYNVFSGAPQAAQMLYGQMLALGDSRLTALLHFSFAAATAATLWVVASTFASRSAGLLAALLFLSCPIVAYAGTFSGVDLVSAFFTTLTCHALLRSLDEGETTPGWSICAGLLLGFACSTKYNVWPVAAGLVAAHAYLSIRRERSLRGSLTIAVVSFAAVLPWLVKNVVLHGNPIYPFLQTWRADAPQLADWSSFISAAQARDLKTTFTTGSGFSEFLTLPWTLSSGAQSMDNWLGAAFIPLLPWLLTRRTERSSALALLALVGYLGWALTSTQGRFLVPVLPLAALALAVALYEAPASKGLRAAAWCAVLTGTVMNLAANARQNTLMDRWTFLKRGGSEGAYLRVEHASYPAPAHGAVEFANASLPKSAKVLLLGESRVYHLDRDNITPSAYDVNPFWTAVREGTDAQAIRDRLAALGVTHILLNGRGLYLGAPKAYLPAEQIRSKKFEDFWFHYLKPLYDDHDTTSGPARWLFIYEITSTPSVAPTQQFNIPRIVLDSIKR